MNHIPYLRFFVSDYLVDANVVGLSPIEEFCYLRLLFFCFRENGLPRKPDVLRELCKGKAVSKRVLRLFIAHPDKPGCFTHKRILSERELYENKCEQNAVNGRLGALAKKTKGLTQAPADRTATERTANQNQNQNQNQKEAALPIDQAKIQGAASSPAVEKSEPLSLQVKTLSEEKSLPTARWVSDPLRKELYEGIFRKGISDTFFDCRELSFDTQLTECVKSAVTSLALNRVRRFKESGLDAGSIENAASAKLQTGKQTLALVTDFERRRDQTVLVVARAVTEAAAELIEARRGPQAAGADG